MLYLQCEIRQEQTALSTVLAREVNFAFAKHIGNKNSYDTVNGVFSTGSLTGISYSGDVHPQTLSLRDLAPPQAFQSCVIGASLEGELWRYGYVIGV